MPLRRKRGRRFLARSRSRRPVACSTVRKQDWAQFISIGALAGGGVSLVRGRRRRALALVAAAAAGDAAGRIWSRESPGPSP
jgi:hypothetical protein